MAFDVDRCAGVTLAGRAGTRAQYIGEGPTYEGPTSERHDGVAVDVDRCAGVTFARGAGWDPGYAANQAWVPPSMRISVPVMNAPSSDTSIAMTPAMTDGSAMPAPLDVSVVGRIGISRLNNVQSASLGI